MPRALPIVRVREKPEAEWLFDLEFGWAAHAVLKPALKSQPGCRWTGSNWVIPVEVLDIFKEDLGNELSIKVEPMLRPVVGKISDAALMPPQIKAVRHLAHAWPGGFIDGEMGVGKTPMAIELLKVLDRRTILIVCPSAVRLSWADALYKPVKHLVTREPLYLWKDAPECIVIETGKQAAALKQSDVDGKICIISYNLVQHLVGKKFDAIVPDECHHLKNSKTKRHRFVKEICSSQGLGCYRLGLSGTSITKDTQDLHGPIEALFPGRVSTFYRFTREYCHVFSKEVGSGEDSKSFAVVQGISKVPERAEAMKRRFSSWRYRITKKEMRQFLPPLHSQTVRLRLKKDSSDLGLIGALKAKQIIPRVEDMLESGNTHIVISAHHKNNVEAYRKAFAGKVATGVIRGGMPDRKRYAEAERLRGFDKSVLVCSTEAICEGLNIFDYVDDVVLAELTFKARVWLQWLGRWQRPNRDKPCNLHLFYAEDVARENKMIAALEYSLDQIRLAIGHGETEESAVSILETTHQSKEEIQAALRAAIGSDFDSDGWDVLFED